MSDLFPGLKRRRIRTSGVAINLVHGGKGPPLLLLHGYPQTHAIWHKIAPELAKHFSIVAADLRGYGDSEKPHGLPDHVNYSKRAMAQDQVEVMRALGHDEFFVAGHDRGARVAHRMALDYPAQLIKLAVLDIVPTIEHFERTDMSFALGYYHWFWFAQPHPFPEDLISAAPDIWFRTHTSREPKGEGFFHRQALADYLGAARNPDMIRGMCEDYRAAATIDLEHDRASRAAGVKIQCPLLVLWGSKGKIGKWYDPLAIWRQYCSADVTGSSVDSGHYLAEEAPGEVLEHFARFFG